MKQWMCALAALWIGAAAAAPGWMADGRPGPLEQEALGWLNDAASHGLDPRDYDAPALTGELAAAASAGAGAGAGAAPPRPEAAAELGQRLDAAFRRYLSDLNRGRVEPRAVHLNFRAPRLPALDIDALLRGALAAGRLADAVQSATPALPAYARLREALAHYRTLAGHAAWAQPLPALPRPGKLAPDGLWDGVPRLTARLQALGDLPAQTAVQTAAQTTVQAATQAATQVATQTATSFMYDSALVDGVRAFQRRHGLTDDGVIGRTTLAALQVSPAARVRQIELTMERLRWTPLMQGPRMIVINVPEFVLRAYEVADGRIVVRTQMKVVVGKSADTRTPLFDEDLRFIEFSPYWNVPPSIARGELVPRLRRDPGHWAREGFEFVGAGGVDTVLSPEKLEAVLAGRVRIRQRPGPRNALGDIKFVFPNRDNIYLHHTPSVSLFERDRRDFSHGCIRVEEPLALAKFVLQDQPGWSEARIREAMAAGTSSTLRVEAPVPVLIAYGTTLVRNGRTFFYDDIYGHDRRLDAALKARRPKP